MVHMFTVSVKKFPSFPQVETVRRQPKPFSREKLVLYLDKECTNWGRYRLGGSQAALGKVLVDLGIIEAKYENNFAYQNYD